jgi:acetylornithine aminotransferase
LGNGVPIGACLARGKAATLFSAGMHGSTFGGNPLVCTAALAVLKTLEKDDLIAKAETKGQKIADAFRKKLQDNPQVVEIRHKGLMIGIELSEPCAALVAAAQQQGLLINVTNERVIRLLPPLVIKNKQIEFLVKTLSALIQEHTQLM